MKITRTLLASWSMKVIVFLLRGSGGAAFGILVGFTVSYFFRFSGRVDVFAFTEAMLGIVITGLAIVGAFIVALQWSNLDSRIYAFDREVGKTKETMQKSEESLIRIVNSIEDGYKTHEKMLSDFPGKYTEIMQKNTERAEREVENIRTLRKMMEELDKHYKMMSSAFKMSEVLLSKIQEENHMLNGTVESEPAGSANVGRNDEM